MSLHPIDVLTSWWLMSNDPLGLCQGLRKKFWTCLPEDKDAEPRVRKDSHPEQLSEATTPNQGTCPKITRSTVEKGSVGTRLPGTETRHVGKILSAPGL